MEWYYSKIWGRVESNDFAFLLQKFKRLLVYYYKNYRSLRRFYLKN